MAPAAKLRLTAVPVVRSDSDQTRSIHMLYYERGAFKRAEGKPSHVKVCLDYKKWVDSQSVDLQAIQKRLKEDLAMLQQLPDKLRDMLVRTVSRAAEDKKKTGEKPPYPL